MQKFKGDDLENKMIGVGEGIFDALSLQKDLFFQGAYEAMPFGDLIWDDQRSPLSRAIERNIFRQAFSEIFQAFGSAGTFESYLLVFEKIFGESVDVTFTVPAPGKLEIDIVADELEISNFVSRYIQSGAYVFDEIVDYDGDNIVFQTVKGFQSQYELEQMLFEMVPAGVYTEISLTFGEE